MKVCEKDCKFIYDAPSMEIVCYVCNLRITKPEIESRRFGPTGMPRTTEQILDIIKENHPAQGRKESDGR